MTLLTRLRGWMAARRAGGDDPERIVPAEEAQAEAERERDEKTPDWSQPPTPPTGRSF